MLAGLLALAISLQSGPRDVVLYRGADLGLETRYWAVEDTFLDTTAPEENFGRDPLLTVGPGRTLLVRFGDLRRALGDVQVISARLVLESEIGSPPRLGAIGTLNLPFGEGGGRRGVQLGASAPQTASLGSSTFRHRRSGPSPVGWRNAGAGIPGDAQPIEGITSRAEGSKVIIEGLEDAIQRFLDQPLDNHGFALTFQEESDFPSAEAGAAGPRLELAVAPATPREGPDLAVDLLTSSNEGNGVRWTATVRNAGSLAVTSFSVRWVHQEREVVNEEVATPLAPGEATTVSLVLPDAQVAGDHRQRPLRVDVQPGLPDSRPWNNALLVDRNALPITLTAPSVEEAQAAVGVVNETILPHSRFSFAREGSTERVRLHAWTPGEDGGVRAVLRELGLRAYERPEGAPRDRYAGILGGGDTRDDLAFPGLLPLIDEPWPDAFAGEISLPVTDLLASADVAILQAWMTAPESRGDYRLGLPQVILVQAADSNGVSRPNLKVKAQGATTFDQTTSARGSLSFRFPGQTEDLFGSEPGPGAAVLLTASEHGESPRTWLKLSQLIAARARANGPAAIAQVRFALPAARIDRSTDLAAGKLVRDSANISPTVLGLMIDADSATVAEIPSGSEWIEIDLGRDRAIGEVRIVTDGGIWQDFEIQFYGTGQRVRDALTWAREVDGTWSLANRVESGALVYRSFAAPARFVRILVNKPSDGAVRIRSIEVYPISVGPAN